MSVLLEATEKSHVLVEALPWLRRYAGATIVVKIGGEPLADLEVRGPVARDIALLAQVGVRVVVVHGAGPQINRAMEEAGLTASFVDGLRVTDDATMDIVAREVLGATSTEMTRALAHEGLKPVALSGADGDLLRAVPASTSSGETLGRVGTIEAVAPAILSSLLDAGFTPVIASIAPDAEGTLLNVNADEVAGAVAGAIGATKLAYLTNVAGLYEDLGDSGSLISAISRGELAALLPNLSSGMVPKARSALAALEDGVGKVHFLDGRIPHVLLLEIFTDEGVGTQVTT